MRKIPSRDETGDQRCSPAVEDWGPAFLKRQVNRGAGRKTVIRKLNKARSQQEKVILADAACVEAWQEGVAYCSKVEI